MGSQSWTRLSDFTFTSLFMGGEIWEGKPCCRTLFFPPDSCPQDQDGFSTQGMCDAHALACSFLE